MSHKQFPETVLHVVYDLDKIFLSTSQANAIFPQILLEYTIIRRNSVIYPKKKHNNLFRVVLEIVRNCEQLKFAGVIIFVSFLQNY